MSSTLKDSDLVKHLMVHMEDNIYFMDRQGRIILINDAGARWLGFDSPAEVIGKTDLDIFSTEHGRAAFEDEQQIMQAGVPVLGKEEKETWADGRVTWVSTSKMPLRDEKGEIVGVFGISRDITDRKESEIRAARYAEENRRFRESMEDDLHMAQRLQETFFPTSYPVFPAGSTPNDSAVLFSHHHHAGGMVGGDFCSVRKLSATEVGIFMCDVMGHGVQAALGTAIVRGMVEEISDKEKDPARYLERMNAGLITILRQGDLFRYATASYMVLDVASGVVRYANANHPRPVLIDSDSGSVEWFMDGSSSAGPGLAILENPAYQTSERRVQPGDTVFMFTDGISEVAGPGEEEFGEDRLLASVSKHREMEFHGLFAALLNEAREFSAEGDFDDDVCLVGFRLQHLAPPV